MKKTILFGCGMIVILALAIVVWVGGMVASEALRQIENEKCLQSMLVVSLVLSRYVETQPSPWPSSWSDLADKVPAGEVDGGMYSWPENLDEIKERVRVDFGGGLERFQEQTVETFSGIEAKGPCFFLYREYAFPPLLEAIHERLTLDGKEMGREEKE